MILSDLERQRSVSCGRNASNNRRRSGAINRGSFVAERSIAVVVKRLVIAHRCSLVDFSPAVAAAAASAVAAATATATTTITAAIAAFIHAL